MLPSIQDISNGVVKGDFLLLAKTISKIENKIDGTDVLLESLVPGKAPIIGITGPPGAGKSTLIAAMIGYWVNNGKKVAVLSVDPSSPYHHGAILGDRIRMKEWYLNANVFIRSLASRGHLGGLNSSMIELTTLLQSVGFDYIVVETVGVGQSEVEVASLADTTIVVLVPEAGDEVQMMKSGLMEIADLFVVNKSDRPDAQTFSNHIQQMLMDNMKEAAIPKVISMVASQGIGIDDLILAIEAEKIKPLQDSRVLNLRMSKLIQLILAQKMSGLDQQSIKNKLKDSLHDNAFNLFAFAKKYYQ
jgi:LAO/AO transport system kinase